MRGLGAPSRTGINDERRQYPKTPVSNLDDLAAF
jgi:hypothetical protein